MVTACQNSIFNVPALPRAPLAAAALEPAALDAALLEVAAAALLAVALTELAVVDAPAELPCALLLAPLLAVPMVDDTAVVACPPQLASSVARGTARTVPRQARNNLRRLTPDVPTESMPMDASQVLKEATSVSSRHQSPRLPPGSSAPQARMSEST